LSGRDVFAALPTGYGKSLCYGCLPLARDKLLGTQGSVVLVVSPLIALMKDQVQSFRKRDISAAYVTSDGDVECNDMKAGFLEGKYQLVFISPERLTDNTKFSCMCQSKHHQSKLIVLMRHITTKMASH
jgi:superfamily II DNA helicase RecQ